MTFIDIAEAFLKAVSGELDPHTKEKGVVVIDSDGQSVTLFTPAHIQFAIYGRGPGKKPPLDNILKWVITEGIIFGDSTAEGTAFAIQASIGKNGTKNWVPNAPNALQEAVNDNLQKYYDEVGDRSLQVINEEMDKIYEEVFPPTAGFKI